MRENEQRKRIQDIIDHRLSGLQGNPWLAQRIIVASKGEQPIMKRKISAGLVLAIVTLLVVATALAAGLVFSPRYDAAKIANEAMLSKYGISAKLMTMFYRETTQAADGNTTVTYTPLEAASQLGVYTVTVKDGKAEAVWSHDGADSSGGLAAEAWGKEQVEMLVTDYSTVMRYLLDHATPPMTADADASSAMPSMSEEEYHKAVAENKEKVLSAAKISLPQAKESAVKVLEGEYDLTSDQVALLQIFDDEETYLLKDGKPTVSLYYHLSQGEEWVEKDGIYVVKVDLETGVIEDIIYDSALAGNG